jgi:hypothetical protein
LPGERGHGGLAARLGLCVIFLGRVLGAVDLSLAAKVFSIDIWAFKLQGVQPPDVLGEQVVVHDAPVLGSVDPHDVVIGQILEPGPVPQFAVLPVAGTLGRDHIRRHAQRDLPVGRALALGASRVAVLDGDVIAEEPCRARAGVGDQSLAGVQFQAEGFPEERRQPGLISSASARRTRAARPADGNSKDAVCVSCRR